MKDSIERFKALPWYGKILSIPGLLIVFGIGVVISPFILIFLMLSYTYEVLGVDDDLDIYY